MINKAAFRLLISLILTAGLALAGVVRGQTTADEPEKKITAGPDAQPTTATVVKSDDKGDKTESGATKDAAKPQGDTNPYSVISSVEFGVRGVSVDGGSSAGNKFRSDLNYTPGFRIFDASLVMKSNGNGGPLFDQLLVNSFGWGTDPNRYLRVNSEKAKWYKFDATYRRLDYFNSLTNLALNQHISNTQYRQGDFDLTLLPTNEKFRLNLGYSLDRNSGPGLLTYDYSRDEFPVLTPTRWAADDYRIGFDSKLWVFDLSFMQGWRVFKEDTTYSITEKQLGNNPTNTTVLDTFHRELPTRGETPYTRFSLHTFLKKRLDFTGRYIYSSSTSNLSLFESLTGVDFSNNKVVLDSTAVTARTKRPNAWGDVGATLFVTDRFRISETFRVNNFRINGGDELDELLERTRSTAFGETPLPNLVTNTIAFRTTKYRRYLNLIEGDFDLNSRLSFHLGYRYTNRHIELRPLDIVVGQPAPEAEDEIFDNHTDTLVAGFKLRPIKMWSLYFDAEHGANDNVFTRTANYDFTNFRVRSIIRPTRKVTVNASLVTKDNTNPSIAEDFKNFGADVNSRIFSSSVDWTPSDRFNLSSGYTHFHITSEASIIFFLNNVSTQGLARYFMRDNFAFMTAYWEPHPRVRLYASYRIHHDQGEGDRGATPTLLISSYPYQLQSPEVRFSVKLHKNVDWIAGYQYFDYKEKFVNSQFYQAHLPYTSLRIHFGGGE